MRLSKCGLADCFLVWNVGGYLGEGRPLTLRGTIAVETGIDLAMVSLGGRSEPVSAIASHGFAPAVIPTRF